MWLQVLCHHPLYLLQLTFPHKSLSQWRDVNFIPFNGRPLINGSVSPMLSNPDMFNEYWSSADRIAKLL